MCVRCTVLATKGSYCVEHAPIPFAKAKVRWRNQRPSNWPALRRKVIRRAGGCCEKCGEPGNQVDHCIPVFEGGGWSLDNLWLLCGACHKAKTEEEKQRARRTR